MNPNQPISDPHWINEKQVRNISKFLSLVLRHNPDKIGIQLDAQGWTDIEELMKKAAKNPRGRGINRQTLEYVVANNNKKRFSISEDGKRIRANQGHSVDIQLGYEPVEPPEYLFHGTVEKFLDAIFQNGLLKMSRHAVHLSQDLDTAENVGNRRGKAIILKVKALEMHKAGNAFFISENDVWLTDTVPPEFIERMD